VKGIDVTERPSRQQNSRHLEFLGVVIDLGHEGESKGGKRVYGFLIQELSSQTAATFRRASTMRPEQLMLSESSALLSLKPDVLQRS